MELVLEDKLKKRFQRIQELYLDAITNYASKYVTEIEIQDIAKMLKGDVSSAYYNMNITLSSHNFEKSIEFIYSNGLDFNGNHHKSVMFSIRSDGQWFNIRDYLVHNGLDYNSCDYFEAKDTNETLEKVGKFIKQIVFVLKRDDIKHILSTKDWIKVPHDKSMYF